MKIEIGSNAEETIRKMQEDAAQYKAGLSLNVFRALTLIEAQIKQNIRKDSGLHVRTGALLNSVGSSKKVFEDVGGEIVGETGIEGIPYAAIHEFGGVVSAKNAKFLTIPTEENRRADGLPKITISDLFGSLKQWTFISKGVVFLQVAGKKGSKFAEIRPMFILKKSVTIPARPYVRPALAATQDTIMKEFGLFIQASFPDWKG